MSATSRHGPSSGPHNAAIWIRPPDPPRGHAALSRPRVDLAITRDRHTHPHFKRPPRRSGILSGQLPRRVASASRCILGNTDHGIRSRTDIGPSRFLVAAVTGPPARARTRPRRSLRCDLTSIMNSFPGAGANTGYGGIWLPLAAILSCLLGEHLADGIVEGVQCADHLLLGEGQRPS